MNYPSGPYGQGFPGQPGYPQQGGYQPGYPQPGGYPAPYPPPVAAAPSGATGIIACVLAGLGGVANFFGGIVMAFGLAGIVADSNADTGSAGGEWTGLIAVVMINIVTGVLLMTGTGLLLLRKMAGRWLVVAGCATTTLSTLISFSLPSTIGSYHYDRGVGPDLVGLVFAAATLVLTLLPSTAAWLNAKRNPVASQYYPYYPPYPG